MESRILLDIHAHAGPLLDVLFRFSHALGSLETTATLVLVAAMVHALRGERREAIAWLTVGIVTAVSIELLKGLVGRPRPQLWPRLVTQGGTSFPSGHAIVGAAFYPLLAWDLTRRSRPAWPYAMAAAVVMALVVGLGRLYLGLHWPTDVLGGWAIGALESATAIAWLRRDDPAR